MIEDWSSCKNILCIRPDNMGDLIMSGPAMRALKQSSGAKITVLTSSMAAGITPLMPEIDEVIVFDLPWVKKDGIFEPQTLIDILIGIRERNFDAAVIFSVYSQNPLPSVMLAYLAGIPKRLSYCRENPYELLTHWVPDKEPYSIIKHQVQRDLDLVGSIAAFTNETNLELMKSEVDIVTKLKEKGVDSEKPYIIMHPGVSERKREYPEQLWTQTARKILDTTNYQILFTGAGSEKALTQRLQTESGKGSFSLAGDLSLTEFVELIRKAPLVISVNTGTVHIAAATQTPLVVLYALTNPQHYPWQSKGIVYPFDVQDTLKSKNEVIKFVNDTYFNTSMGMTSPQQIANSAKAILNGNVLAIPQLPEQVLQNFESLTE